MSRLHVLPKPGKPGSRHIFGWAGHATKERARRRGANAMARRSRKRNRR